MTHPKIMPDEERKALIGKLGEIDRRISDDSGELEEEQTDAYDTTIHRLRAAADEDYAMELETRISSELSQ